MATAASETWPLVKWTEAAQVVARVGGDEPPVPVEDGSGPAAFFERLAQDHPLDAITFLAHALPRYECIVWGARGLLETDAVNRRDPLMTAVMRWIDNPDDTLRRAIQGLVELETKSTPVAMLANAVWLSGGSLSDPELPAVLPPDHVCAKLAGGALVMGAYTVKDPAAAMQRMLTIGREIAAGPASR